MIAAFRRRHWRHAGIVGLLVFTGFALFLSSWRRTLGIAFLPVQLIHSGGGLLYGGALVGWGRRVFPWPEGGRPGWVRWGYFFLVMLAVSGLGLWVGPSLTHALATVVHGISAVFFVGWMVWHLVVMRPRRQVSYESRRRLLRWGLVTLPTAWIAWYTPSVLAMVTGRLFQVGRNRGALPGFVPYTVVDGYPSLSRSHWTLGVDGLHNAVQVSWDEFSALPHTHVTIDFRCVTGWVVPHTRFGGVDLYFWLKSLGWDDARLPWVTFYSADGVYRDSLNAAQIREYRPLLADTIDGQPLPISQGYPVRLVVPAMYGYKSVKWVVRIVLSRQETVGYWEARGYPENAAWQATVNV
ncbi:MAG: molybdopterin-dependent oxidoreductase [Sulfobacillus sp.]|nr:molybdopterin-dependent oxidoreductase [Sulfobacillus sp.]